MNNLGLVVIGRNEGDRLKTCLLSAIDRVKNIVYVDSGSSDESLELARSLGVDTVELDLTIPFTAARARNEGFTRLLGINPEIEFVQFVDGDCEIVTDWLETALFELRASEDLAVVCGRRRERFPQRSIYNLLCDLEWNTPIGEAKACGGDAMMRVSAFERVGGFDSSLIAGEEPELCLRLRLQGWKVLRINAEMTVHDAAMTKFPQWWNRTMRSGHAYAEGAWLHGRSPEKHWVKESKSIWFWGLVLPVSILSLSCLTQGWGLSLLLAYPVLIYRIYSRKKLEIASQKALIYGLFCAIGKFAQVQGQIKFYLAKLSDKQTSLIEYKTLAMDRGNK